MICPVCGSNQICVVDSRTYGIKKFVRRRRKCLKCNERFSTVEVLEDEFKTMEQEVKFAERVKKGFAK